MVRIRAKLKENTLFGRGLVKIWAKSKNILFVCFVCLFDLILYVPSIIVQLYRDGSSWVVPVLSWVKCVLLKDHNAVLPGEARTRGPSVSSQTLYH